jgi:glutathione S-transferase
MTLTLHHHPHSRAATVVWMLEEVGVPYELSFVDLSKGAHKSPEMLAKNPMGKLPVLTDGDLVVTEVAAIGLYLADRYAYGRLAPEVGDRARGTYLRWSFFAPSVIEPGTMAKKAGWVYREGQAGWGSYDAMLASIESALAGRDYVLGDTFSMADVVLGGTLRYMLRFDMIDKRDRFVAYADRLAARPASVRAEERNAQVAKAHGLG